MRNQEKKIELRKKVYQRKIISCFKGKVMQIGKSTNMSLIELCAREICEMFVYKHSETIEYDKN